MLLNELVDLNKWLIEKEKNFQPIDKLARLQSILQSNVQARQPNNRNQPQEIQSFTKEKEEAIEALGFYKLSELSKDQVICLAVHNADKYMGMEADEDMRETFRNEVHDLAYLQQYVEKAHQALNSARSKLAEVNKSITPYSKAITEEEYLQDKARLSIIFKGGVGVDSLDDLESRAKDWSKIIHGIGVGLSVPPSDFKVLGARNGSLIIDLFMCSAAIIPIGFILNRSLAIIERFALSLKRIESIYDLDLSDPAFQKLEEQIKATNEEYFNLQKLVSAQKIASEILEEKGVPENERAEAQSFLESSIKKILNHFRKGGDLDAYVPKEEGIESEEIGEDDSVAQASELIESFRHKKLTLSKEDFVKLLEHFDFEDEEPNA